MLAAVGPRRRVKRGETLSNRSLRSAGRAYRQPAAPQGTPFWSVLPASMWLS